MSAGAGLDPTDATPAPATAATPVEDLFSLGRRANALRDAALGRRGTFARARRLLATSAWRGPRDASVSYVEAADLAALGGWAAARDAGATTLVGADLATLKHAAGARLVARVPFRGGESEQTRLARLRALVGADLSLWGVIPTPEGEPYGLDTVRFTAVCRLELPAATHVVAEVETLGPRLAQMCFGFGADDLFAQIMSERALRLGDNANNPVLTRKEAVTLIRGAGLVAAERLVNDVLEDALEEVT
jgi:hypothetical protein